MKIENKILDYTLEYFNINKAQLLNKSRAENLVNIKACYAKVLREYAFLSYPQIAKLMGYTHHTSIMYLLDKDSRNYRDYFEFIGDKLKFKAIRSLRKSPKKEIKENDLILVQREISQFKRDFTAYIKQVLDRHKGFKIDDNLIKKIVN